MIKFNWNWLNLGTGLFIITYINLTVLVTHIFYPNLLVNINLLLNELTNNFISNTFSHITYEMIVSLYRFYIYLIVICCLTVFISSILSLFKLASTSRLSDIIGWLICLLIHQFNTMLIAFMLKQQFFHELNTINILAFLFFTWVYLCTPNHSKSDSK